MNENDTNSQDSIAAGQVRVGEQLPDAQQVRAPGTLLVFLEPLYEGGLDGATPDSSCIANASTNSHDHLQKTKVGLFTWIFLHIVDTVGVVHAIILRAQALLLPVKALVFSGHCRSALWSWRRSGGLPGAIMKATAPERSADLACSSPRPVPRSWNWQRAA